MTSVTGSVLVFERWTECDADSVIVSEKARDPCDCKLVRGRESIFRLIAMAEEPSNVACLLPCGEKPTFVCHELTGEPSHVAVRTVQLGSSRNAVTFGESTPPTACESD